MLGLMLSTHDAWHIYCLSCTCCVTPGKCLAALRITYSFNIVQRLLVLLAHTECRTEACGVPHSLAGKPVAQQAMLSIA